jgi:putative DNA primase/helicase
LGFVFTESDPFCGVDLDSCVDPETGEIASWASEIVGTLDSYTEFSPSGTGLHVLLRAELPSGGNRRDLVEMYDRARFFTVTRRRVRGTSHVVEERQEQLAALHARLFSPRERDVPKKQGKIASNNGLDDATDARIQATDEGRERSACENGSIAGGAARAQHPPRSRRAHPTRGRPGLGPHKGAAHRPP